jgi:hypothetical protein
MVPSPTEVAVDEVPVVEDVETLEVVVALEPAAALELAVCEEATGEAQEARKMAHKRIGVKDTTWNDFINFPSFHLINALKNIFIGAKLSGAMKAPLQSW